MKYNVKFGSSFSVDEFGFVHDGEVTIDADNVTFTGKKNWPALARWGVVLAMWLVPQFLFKITLVGIIPGMLIVYFLGTTKASIAIPKSSVCNFVRNEKKITFSGIDSSSGKQKKTTFKVDTEENAKALETELATK
jgi:hypothetical protein